MQQRQYYNWHDNRSSLSFSREMAHTSRGVHEGQQQPILASMGTHNHHHSLTFVLKTWSKKNAIKSKVDTGNIIIMFGN